MNATTDEIKVTEHEVIQAMYRFGGGFAQALAAAFECADASNFERLRSAFPELWMKSCTAKTCTDAAQRLN